MAMSQGSTIARRFRVPARTLAAFCRRNHIRRLSLFGSVARSDFRRGSDVDVLVEFETGKTPGFLGMARLELELGSLAGRKVDLRTPAELSPYFRDEVLGSAVETYVAA